MVSLEKIIGSVLSDGSLHKSITHTLWSLVASSTTDRNINVAASKSDKDGQFKKSDEKAAALRVLSMVLHNNKATNGTKKNIALLKSISSSIFNSL